MQMQSLFSTVPTERVCELARQGLTTPLKHVTFGGQRVQAVPLGKPMVDM
jgi:hypothetical protein